MEEKYSVEESKTLRTGIITLLAILVAVFITISHNASIKGGKVGGAYEIYASFGRTDGLNVGDVVRMAGVNVGRVIEADLEENFTTKLTLEIDSKYKIPDDSSASIVSFGLIGGKYIEIDVGGSEDYVAPGGEISYTQDAMILEELLDRIISLGKSKQKAVHKESVKKTEEKIEEKSEEKAEEKAEETSVEKVEENTKENTEESSNQEEIKETENE